MKTIVIDKSMSIDIEFSINAIDQCDINSLKDLQLQPFDQVEILWNDKKIFMGFCIDARLTQSFGQQQYEYTINSPLWILSQQKTEAKTTYLQLFLKECADLCNLQLDYQIETNPLIYVEEGTYFDALKKCILFTKNYNTRFYVDYSDNKLVFTDKIAGLHNKIEKVIRYEFEWDTEIINVVYW